MRQGPNEYMRLKSKTKRPTQDLAKPLKKNNKHATKPSKPLETPQFGTLAFGKLQFEWYARLKDSFKDLERFDKIGNAHDYMSAQSLRSIANYYCPIKERFFMRLRNFVTHNPHWIRNALHLLVGRLHSEGVPYRTMIKLARAHGHSKGTSIFSIHRMVKKFELRALEWNKIHPEGLDFVSDIG